VTNEIPGSFTDGETPLPIPNREVKPIRADGTMLVTAWKSRSLPGLFFAPAVQSIKNKTTRTVITGISRLTFEYSSIIIAPDERAGNTLLE
jgi:hypothetical protein